MKNELITFVSPKTQISEVFRTLRTNIQFMNVDGNLKSLLVTSTVPGEGKSWVSANLAITFAQAGKRVLIVDADMRKGRQHDMFELKNTKGLSNYLIMTTKESSLETIGEYIQNTLVDNLYVMTSGMVPPNPSELLTSQKMVDLINYLEKIFDIVIFDGTPSTIVTDAIILSKFVDTTLIVAGHKITKTDDLNQVKRNIINVGGKIAGVILNKMPITKRKSKGGYYYENSVVTSKKSNNKIIDKLTKKTTPVKKVEDDEIKEVKKKLNSVEKESSQKSETKEDIDINIVLKQLSQYLTENDKK
ncbi:MAG: CpsD/CapB family tyrosine-protein kinase [Clostridia bacterium]|nr:CpsD/CapB family tyrosine-protein kinase [Clostridia bacterium]